MTVITTNLVDVSGTPLLGGWEFIETQTASTSSEIVVTNLSSDYQAYKFIWSQMEAGTVSQRPFMRVSTDNGATFLSGGSDYSWAYIYLTWTSGPSHSMSGDNLDTTVVLAGDLGTGANDRYDMEMTCFNPMYSGTHTHFTWDIYGLPQTGTGIQLKGSCAYRGTTNPVNAVRFYMESGNIDSGTLWVYGIK